MLLYRKGFRKWTQSCLKENVEAYRHSLRGNADGGKTGGCCMILKQWEDLPAGMRREEVRTYYESLRKKTCSLKIKRGMDLLLSVLLLVITAPVFAVIAAVIRIDSAGPVFFRQERVTQYGRIFRIYKFRTMAADSAGAGTRVTVKNDMRVTRAGKVLRKYRLDELPQLLNILAGDMTFVGTRPEVPYYVRKYQPVMRATLLLPAGVTSEASIRFKNEEKMLERAEDADDVYLKKILPLKMAYNLRQLERFSIRQDVRTLVRTVLEVAGSREDAGTDSCKKDRKILFPCRRRKYG